MTLTAVVTEEGIAVVESPATTEAAPATVETPVFQPGDRVRVSDEALDGSGYTARNARGTTGVLDFYDTYSGWFVRPDDGGYGNYVAPAFLTHLTPEELLQEQVTTLTAQLELAARDLESARTLRTQQANEFEAWKANLQEVALEAAEDNELCRIFDQVMERVGLEGREREITLHVEFSGTVEFTTTATSRANARDEIDTASLLQYMADHHYYVSFEWDTEVDD